MTELGYEAIREYAERVGEHHAIYDELGHADLDALLSKIGGKTEASPPGDLIGRRELLLVRGPGDFTVPLSALGARRRRFETARGIGLWYLEYVQPGRNGRHFIDRDDPQDLIVAANTFASTLLTPAQQFRAAWAQHDGDRWALAAQFDVSPAAVAIRAEVLGLGDLRG